MPLRVAMLAAVFPPSVGGIQTHTLRLSQHLVRLGARVLVLTRHHSGLRQHEWLEGVEVMRVGNGDAPRALATLSYVAGALAELARRRTEIDLLHAHQLLSPTTIGLAARAFWGLPLIVNPHACGALGDVGQLSATGWLKGGWRLGAVRRCADAFVCISGIIRGELSASGIDSARLCDIPNGVDTRHFRPGLPEERRQAREAFAIPEGRLAVYAGRLSAEKGVDTLLDAVARLPATRGSLNLAVLGDGPETAALKAQAARLRVLPRVRFVGAVANVADWLRAADLFVLPSRTEGLPVSLLEAMATGLPCVATRVGGTPQVLQDGHHGRLVPPEDPGALAAALHETSVDTAAAAWGASARRHVEANYSLEHVAKRTLSLYQAVSRRSGLAPLAAPPA